MKILPKVFLIILAITIITSFSSAYFVYVSTQESLRKVIANEQLELAKQTMDKTDRLLETRMNDILMISESEMFESFLASKNKNDPKKIAEGIKKLQEITAIGKYWKYLDIVDVNYNIVLNDGGVSDYIGSSFPEAHQVDRLVLDNALAGEANYTDAFLHDGNKMIGFTMLFAAPIRNKLDPQQPVIGAVVGHLNWEDVVEVLKNTEESEVELFNSEGLLIGHNELEEEEVDEREFLNNQSEEYKSVTNVFKGQNGSGIFANPDHADELVLNSYVRERGYRNYKGNGWSVMIETPVSTAFASAKDNSINYALAVFFMSFLGGIVLLFFLQRVVIIPILKLRAFSEEFAQGIFQKRIQVESSDEIGQLGFAFNLMADQLQSLYADLQSNIKQLDDEKIRLKSSIDNLSIGYVMMDMENEVVIINTTAKNILTLHMPADHLGKRVIEDYKVKDGIDMNFIQKSLKDSVDIKKKLDEAKKKKTSVILKNISYKTLILNLYITPIVSEEGKSVLGTVLLIDNITERKIVERSRDEFFSIASHELRTPLTVIRGNTSLIQDYFFKEIKNSEVKDIILDIHNSSVRLIEIVNDFLDMSRLEQGRMEYKNEVFDVVKICKDVIREFDVTSSRKKISLQVVPPSEALPSVYADKGKFRQIIVNLVGNSVKYTDNGRIKISFKENGKYVKVFVADEGRGIEEKNKYLLFRKFQQAQTNMLIRDPAKSTGLGLYISKFMANDMGGDVALENSELGHGSTFSVTIPLATEPNKGQK